MPSLAQMQELDQTFALAEAAGNTQNSPLMGSLREKRGQHPILEVYCFHISYRIRLNKCTVRVQVGRFF